MKSPLRISGTAFLASSAVTYLYETGEKALAKARMLQRMSKTFELRDGVTNALLSIAELAQRLRQS